MFMVVSLHECLCRTHMPRTGRGLENGLGSPETGVANGCEPPCTWVLGTGTRSSEKAAGMSFLNELISSFLNYIVLIINTTLFSDTMNVPSTLSLYLVNHLSKVI